MVWIGVIESSTNVFYAIQSLLASNVQNQPCCVMCVCVNPAKNIGNSLVFIVQMKVHMSLIGFAYFVDRTPPSTICYSSGL